MRIVSVAFDGPNRSGKGLQIEKLSQRLREEHTPHITIRGDGSRERNELIENNLSPWWEDINLRLHDHGSINDWNIAACKLAEELVYCKNNVLPEVVQKNNADIGLLLIDRSILSRAVVVSEYLEEFTMDDLYPEQLFQKGKVLTIWDVLPDIVFLLSAPKEILISRLDKNDSKYSFRKALIDKKGDWYGRVISHFPEAIKSRIVALDGTREPEQLHLEIYKTINDFKTNPTSPTTGYPLKTAA